MTFRSCLFTSLISLFSISCFSQDGVKPIIDMHIHDYGVWNYFQRPTVDGIESPETYVDFRKQTYEMLEKYNVVKAVVSTIGGDFKPDTSGRLIPGYYTGKPPEDTTEFIRLIESGQLKVFGEVGAIYQGYTISDPEFEPFLDICERYDIPVAVHTGGGPPNMVYRGNPNFRLKLGNPLTVEDALARHPDLRIYLMHAGGFYVDEIISLMKHYTHVYADLGVVLWMPPTLDNGKEFLEKAKRNRLIDRVLFGSDQMGWPGAIERSIQVLDSYDFLTEEDKRKIFYENAVRFLKLEDDL